MNSVTENAVVLKAHGGDRKSNLLAIAEAIDRHADLTRGATEAEAKASRHLRGLAEQLRIVADEWPDPSRVVSDVEQTGRERLRVQKEFRKRVNEADYFAGAMAVLQSLYPHKDGERLSPMVPPKWVLYPMSGRSILKEKP
jgi:hypothetical protein